MSSIEDLIKRVLPKHYTQIEYEFCDNENGKDVYEIDSRNGKLLLRGNNCVSIASALGYYLKNTAKVNISWCGGNMNLPEKLVMPSKIRKVIDQRYRVYMNYCTFNYTASWWNFERWEKEIDFMALNGINMPLAAVGIEGVWYYTLLKLGFNDSEAREFLAGPAFLAWQWMTNLEGFGGPLPKSWIDKRIELGKKIIERELELGMQPIQQGFSGFVPKKIIEKYPDCNADVQKPWFGMKPVVQLDPLDGLFKKIGLKFMETQEELFGSHGFYATDPFHEGEPPQDSAEYLNKVGNAIVDLFDTFDKDYTWVMQAWSIRKDIACAVPKEKLLILDLNGETHKDKDNFWGYNFILGNLHNFGGRIKLHGDLRLLAENKYTDLKNDGIKVVGTGLFMEGIEQNPVYYDLAFEMLTNNDKVDVEKWLDEYTVRRYNTDDDNAKKAWRILLDTAYNTGTNGVENSSIICARPALDAKKSGPNGGFVFPYEIKDLKNALDLLLKVESDTDGYTFDIVDVQRQVLSDYAYKVYLEMIRLFKDKNREEFVRCSDKFLKIFDDLDNLVSTRDEYSFARWIRSAHSWAENDEEKKLYDYNATALVTVWGYDEDSELFDYSWREWSGLISDYYKKRWIMFITMLSESLENGTEYSEDGLPLDCGRESWRASEFLSSMADMELKWIHTVKTFKQKKSFKAKELVKRLSENYSEV